MCFVWFLSEKFCLPKLVFSLLIIPPPNRRGMLTFLIQGAFALITFCVISVMLCLRLWLVVVRLTQRSYSAVKLLIWPLMFNACITLT